jgi:hypothetical protein
MFDTSACFDPGGGSQLEGYPLPFLDQVPSRWVPISVMWMTKVYVHTETLFVQPSNSQPIILYLTIQFDCVPLQSALNSLPIYLPSSRQPTALTFHNAHRTELLLLSSDVFPFSPMQHFTQAHGQLCVFTVSVYTVSVYTVIACERIFRRTDHFCFV